MSRTPRQTAAFSLFTFLDVMLCTLGALIIVLICVVRTAQIKNADAPPEASAEVEEIEAARETAQWRAKHLAASRDAVQAQLKDRRLELSHVEEHSRRLNQQLAELEAAAAKAKENGASRQLAQMREDLKRLADATAAAERDLDDSRRTAESKRPTYAVVPYEGPSQTLRRPMYIECTADQILLQPENIELTAEDFKGPLGPGNPLAAGLRAAREFLINDPAASADDAGEPYPLLLVRPDGIDAYYAAREAMTSWGSEFGYEFIDQDWKLEFRQPQPAMVETIRVAVDEARLRQRALARAAPRYYADNKPQKWYRASSRGGVVADAGPADEEEGNSSGRGPHYGPGHGAWGRNGSSPRGGGGQGGNGNGNYARGGRGGRPGELGSPATTREQDLESIYGAAAAAAGPNGNGLGNGPGSNALAGGLAAAQGTNPGYVPATGDWTGGSPIQARGTTGGPGGYGSGTTDTPPGDGPALTGRGGTPGASGLASATGSGQAATGSGGQSGGKNAGAPTQPGAGGFSGNQYGTGTLTSTDRSGQGGTGTDQMRGGSRAPGAQQGDLGGDGEIGDGADGSGKYADGTSRPAGSTAKGRGKSGGKPGGQGEPGGELADQEGGEPGQYASGPSGGRGSSKQRGAAGGSPGGQAGMVSAGTGAGSAGGSANSAGGQMGSPTVTLGANNPTASSSVAENRGKNWSLPEEARNAVPISRPVRIECQADRLVLRSEGSPARVQEIPLTARTEDSVDDLVSAVWQHVETWGSAGRGMYWQPTLSVDVAPGADSRFTDLQTLMANSGMDVKPAPKAPVQTARPKRKLGVW